MSPNHINFAELVIMAVSVSGIAQNHVCGAVLGVPVRGAASLAVLGVSAHGASAAMDTSGSFPSEASRVVWPAGLAGERSRDTQTLNGFATIKFSTGASVKFRCNKQRTFYC